MSSGWFVRRITTNILVLLAALAINFAVPRLMPGNPVVGTSHAQEIAPGAAEDAAIVEEVGVPFTVPAGTFDDTLATKDVDPLDGGIDPKRYARGIGLILDERLVLISYTN